MARQPLRKLMRKDQEIDIAEYTSHIVKELVGHLVGRFDKKSFTDFVEESWGTGNFLHEIGQSYREELYYINGLDICQSFDTKPFYLPHQVPSTSSLLYNKEIAARLVHDSIDSVPKDAKFSEYNIEPHSHNSDSIIIVTSRHKEKEATYFLHDRKLGFDVVIEVPLTLGSVICFPRGVSHTFRPSDTGLSTLNITNVYQEPHTKGFSAASPCDFDKARLMTYNDYQSALYKYVSVQIDPCQ